VADDEVASGLHALVALGNVLATRAGGTRVGMLLGRLTDRDRQREHVAA
jgi:hypothetical protein